MPLQSQDAPQPEQVAAFFQKHRTGLVTLVFTDLVDSTALLQKLGDQAGATFLKQRREIIRDKLRAIPEGEEIETAGDSFLIAFSKPSDAVRFALLVQAQLRSFSEASNLSVQERIGIHLGEVVIAEGETEGKAKDLYGIQLTTAARVMSLAQGGQILLTRGVFDSARQVLKGEDIPGIGALNWVSHGPYLLKGVDEPIEVCEVGEQVQRAFEAPKTSEKAQRQLRPDEEPVLGWRPAVGQEVPNTPWVLEEKLGEGGFGEVWAAHHPKLKERHVFKFCFRADRVRALKRELTLFRLLKEHVGEHPNIVRLHDVYLNEAPFYLEEEYVEGKDLKTWCEAAGGVETVPLEVRLEIVAQAAEGLQAAHDAGIIHRDVKPGNILVSGESSGSKSLVVKLTDFGIGQVISAEYLKGVTRAGFTETMVGSTSSGTGTAMYLAPEIIAGMPATTRSDLYSLGVVLYQLVVGDLGQPLTGEWTEAISEALLREDLKHCLAGKPEDRFAGAVQIAKNLRSWDQRKTAELRRHAAQAERERLHRQAQQRRKLLLAGTAVVLVLVGLAAVLGYGMRRAQVERGRAQRNLYAADLSLAYRVFEEGNLGTALDMLDRHRPGLGERDLRGWEWRYLWQACQSDELRTLGHHAHFVASVRFFPNGQLLASSSRDGTVKVWELETGKVQATLDHHGATPAIDISPNGRWLATGTENPQGPLRLWDTKTWQEVGRLSESLTVSSLAFSPDGRHLATVGQLKVVIWSTDTQKEVVEFPTTESGAGSQRVCFSPDSRMLAYQDPEDDSVTLWDAERGTNIASLPGHKKPIVAIAFSPDGKHLATGSWDNTVKVWRTEDWREIATLTSHSSWVSSLAFSPTGDLLATASADQRIKLWNTTDWLEIASLKGHLHEIWTLAFSPDGRTLASGGKDATIRLWRSLAEPKRSTVQRLPTSVMSILHSPNGRRWGIVYEDDTIGLWDSAGLSEHARVPLLFPAVTTAAWAVSPGCALIAQGDQDRKVHLWEPDSGQEVAEFDLGDHNAGVISFSPEGTRLAVLAEDRRVIQVWDVTAKRRMVALTNDVAFEWLPAPIFSADAKELLTAHEGGVTVLWDLEASQLKARLNGHLAKTWALAFSPDGQTIATTGDEGTLKLWDKTTQVLLASLRGQLLTLHSVAFSSDGRRVAAGTGGGLIKIWDSETYQEVGTLKGHSQPVGVLAFLPDGENLVSTLLPWSLPRELGDWHAPSFAEIEAAERERASLQVTTATE